MKRSRVFTSAAAIVALFAVSIAATAADAKVKKRPRAAGHAYNSGRVYNSCPVRTLPSGELVDCHGWRRRSIGWDNTCFNLDYLPSQYACSSRGGRF